MPLSRIKLSVFAVCLWWGQLLEDVAGPEVASRSYMICGSMKVVDG